MKPEVRQYKTTMKFYVPKWDLGAADKVDVSLEVVDSWYFKNGSFRKLDIQNLGKVLIDLIAEKQGWDDSCVWSFSARKTHSDTSKHVNVVMRKIVEVTEQGAAKDAACKA